MKTRSNLKLIHGDCIDILKRLRSDSIDLVVTDPPYLVNYTSRDGRTIANDSDSGWIRPAFAEIARVLKPHRFCISFYGVLQADKFFNAWHKAELRAVEHLVWHKHYASSQRIVKRTHECAVVLTKGSPHRPQVLLDDVLPWKYSGNRLHPTQKPINAIEPLIAAFSRPQEIVLDPFMGSGTTGQAALQQGRRFIGIELDCTYFEIAARRLEKKPTQLSQTNFE